MFANSYVAVFYDDWRGRQIADPDDGLIQGNHHFYDYATIINATLVFIAIHMFLLNCTIKKMRAALQTSCDVANIIQYIRVLTHSLQQLVMWNVAIVSNILEVRIDNRGRKNANEYDKISNYIKLYSFCSIFGNV